METFVGTGSSFLAFAAIAASRNMRATAFPTKGIYYLGGLTEGAETIMAFMAMAVWPSCFPIVAWTFAALCVLTTLLRWRQGWIAFSTNDQLSSDPKAPMPRVLSIEP